MTRGVNEVTIAGNVSGPIKYGETGGGDAACSFVLAIDKGTANTTWVRINVYNGLVKVCEAKLEKGQYVIVAGELMNRQRRVTTNVDENQQLTEVRAIDLVFVAGKRGAERMMDENSK